MLVDGDYSEDLKQNFAPKRDITVYTILEGIIESFFCSSQVDAVSSNFDHNSVAHVLQLLISADDEQPLLQSSDVVCVISPNTASGFVSLTSNSRILLVPRWILSKEERSQYCGQLTQGPEHDSRGVSIMEGVSTERPGHSAK